MLVSSSGVVTVNNAASAEEAVHATTADNATNVTNVPVATTSKIGGIKAGANISVSSDGSVIITYADVAGSASTADEATTATYAQNATYDNAGNKIVDTYAKKTELPKIATSTVAGIIKGGGDIAVASDGSVTVNNAGVAQMAQQDSSGRVIVNTYVPKTQIATSSAAGLVKSGNDITVASDGTVTVNSATTADRLSTASNVAGDEDMPDTDSVQSFSGYVGKDKTNKCPILSVTTEFLDGTQQLSLQIGYSTEHGLMCRIGGRETNGEFTFSDWQKILTQDI